MYEKKNVFGQTLIGCSTDPLTGFYRDGCCNTGDDDRGIHTVCVQATEDFLEFSKSTGNDLSTPREEFNFPGVKPGDFWCLCAGRWLEAYRAGKAPRVKLAATHEESLAIIPLNLLEEFSLEQQSN